MISRLINSGTYYGLSWGAAKLSDNEFATYFISAAVEIPAYIFLMCTLNRWGRKPILCGSMITAGAFLLFMTAVPKGNLILQRNKISSIGNKKF